MGKTATRISFQSRLLRPADGGSWTFLQLPPNSSEMLQTRNSISVEGTMNGFPFQVCLQPDGEGGHWFKVEPELSDGANARPGDNVDVELSPMAVELEPEVPNDLKEALSQTPKAFAVWTDTTPTARRDWINWMTSGKKAETRTIRLGKMIDMLSKGKRRVCCYDRSGMYSKVFTCPTPADEP